MGERLAAGGNRRSGYIQEIDGLDRCGDPPADRRKQFPPLPPTRNGARIEILSEKRSGEEKGVKNSAGSQRKIAQKRERKRKRFFNPFHRNGKSMGERKGKKRRRVNSMKGRNVRETAQREESSKQQKLGGGKE